MVTQVSADVGLVLAPNPGPMTLDGTSSYILGTQGESIIVVDPGPDDAAHLRALANAGRVDLILVTHHHGDHTDGCAGLHRLTGAPVRALDPAYCHSGEPLVDGELVEAAGVAVRVIHTPGHTTDSVSFAIERDSETTAVLTGDTVLGRGTTVIMPGDDALANYLASLDRLAALGSLVGHPAHGDTIDDLSTVCAELRAHRLERLAEVRSVADRLGPDADAIVDAVYPDVDPRIRFAAHASVAAQLEYITNHG